MVIDNLVMMIHSSKFPVFDLCYSSKCNFFIKLVIAGGKALLKQTQKKKAFDMREASFEDIKGPEGWLRQR